MRTPFATATRYGRLLALQLRTSLVLAAQYRLDFLVDGAISTFWACTAVVPLFVVYEGAGAALPGWTFGESLVVTAWFVLLQGILEGAINPGLQTVVEHIRKGTLDFLLLKPADAQFLVSTSRFQPWRAFNLAIAALLLWKAFSELGRWPGPLEIASALVLLAAATLLLYSMWILIVSAAFVVVKVDNLTYLFSSVFDAARWPGTVFTGFLRILFTFVVPLVVMTTFPAQALLGRLEASSLAGAVLGAFAFAAAARVVWLRSLRRYSSAGG